MEKPIRNQRSNSLSVNDFRQIKGSQKIIIDSKTGKPRSAKTPQLFTRAASWASMGSGRSNNAKKEFKAALINEYGSTVADSVVPSEWIDDGRPLTSRTIEETVNRANELHAAVRSDEEGVDKPADISDIPEGVLGITNQYLGYGSEAVALNKAASKEPFRPNKGILIAGQEVNDDVIGEWCNSGLLNPDCGLKHLDLSNSSITARGLKMLIESGALNGLESLNLNGCDWVSPRTVKLLCSANLQNLKELKFGSCGRVSDSEVQMIIDSASMPNLKALNLSNTKITNKTLLALLNSPNIKEVTDLHLSGCRNIENETLLALLNSPKCKNLKALSLPIHVSNDVIQALGTSEHLTSLEHLGLSECVEVSDASIEMIAQSENFSNLQSLSLGNFLMNGNLESFKIITDSEILGNLRMLDLRPFEKMSLSMRSSFMDGSLTDEEISTMVDQYVQDLRDAYPDINIITE